MTNVIEAPRLAAEELNEIGEVVAIPWWSPRAPLLPHGEKIAVDIRDSDYVDVSADIELLRQSLNAEEII